MTDWFQNHRHYSDTFGICIRTAIDEVIDTPRTRRWDLRQCETPEKTYLGFKIEHVIRAQFQIGPHEPKRPDYRVDGVFVDCKWSIKWCGWSIPTEAIGHICLLVWASDHTREMAIGLMRITREKLTPGKGNKDSKREIVAAARHEIRWLVDRSTTLPDNFLLHLPVDDRGAILGHRGGDSRARELFTRCDGVIIKRHTLESIGQQRDDMRRFRGDTRTKMREAGFEVLNGHWKDDRAKAKALGGPVPTGSTEWVCLRSDGSSLQRRADSEIAKARSAGLGLDKSRDFTLFGED